MAGKFEPKEPVQLDPPKSDPISPEFLAKCNGMFTLFHLQLANRTHLGVESDLVYVAIKVHTPSHSCDFARTDEHF
jgi:hypothetical protein